MNDAQELLTVLVKAAEGTRKEGFTEGGVTFTVNNTNDTITGNFTIPVSLSADATGFLKIEPQDFLEFQPV